VNRLEEICEALYGERWQSALAQDLGVADRTVRRWVAGDSPVPDDVWPALKRLCGERRAILKKLQERL
jgi:plasmid maintenance system antidote protein VapI